MDTALAFARGQASQGNEMKVFDWEFAAKRIRDTKPVEACAGLAGDWEWTGGTIYRDGKPTDRDDNYTYLASTWATPELELDGVKEDCFRMESNTPGWEADTFWPDEALAILETAAA